MKFTHEGAENGENKWKMVFLLVAVAALIVGALSGMGTGHIIRNMSRALVCVIGFYIVLSIIKMYHDLYKS